MMLRRLFLRLTPLLLLALLAPPAPADEATEAEARAAEAEQARAFERDRLIAFARRAVGGDAAAKDPFAAMQESLAEDHAYMMAYEPKDAEESALLAEFEKTVQERILLVGWPGDGKGTPAKDGALQEARRLDAWLAGLAPCDVVISAAGADPASGKAYSYPPEPKKAEPPPAPPPGEEGAVEAAPPGPPPPAEGEEPTPPAEAEAPPEEPASPPEPKPAPPPEPPKLDDWAEHVVAEQEGGTLLRKVVTTQVCGVVDQLIKAARQRPVYVHPEVRRLRRHAVVSEDVFAYNAPYAALRLQQADEQEKAMQEDQPPASLVDEAMVRSKAVQLAAFTADLEARRKQRAAVVASLKQMVDDLDDWKTQAALLAQEIEERQRALAPPEDEGEKEGQGEAEKPKALPMDLPPAPIALRLAEARESLVSLDITLLYLTAVRADERLKLLDRLIRASEAEAQSAEQAQTRYQAALLKLRGARRLDRLYSDEHRLRLWISRLEETPPEEGTVYAARLEAYRAVLSVLEVVESAVVRQRELAPGGAKEREKEKPAQTAEANGSEAAASPSEKSKSPVPSILRNPDKATWDVKYVELATRALADPEMAEAFDAHLIARHYSAADDRIRALLRARERSTEEAELRGRYDAAREAADAALARLDTNDFALRTRRLPSLLAASGEDFEAAMSGIAKQGERNRKRLEALLGYRVLLRSQGTRSLLIRTDRDLADDDIQRAFGDASYALDKATRWLTLKDQEHAGRFVAASWLRLLGLLAIAAGAIFGVRYLRRRIDLWIERQAEANPLLRHAGVSVREEKAEAKRRREEEDTIADVSAEDILAATAPEEAAPPPVETEGEREEREPTDPTPDEEDEALERPKAKGELPPPVAPAPGTPDRKPAEPPSGPTRGAS